MFGFLKRRKGDPPEAKALEAEFNEVIRQVNEAPPEVRLTVAITLGQAWLALNARFGSVEGFAAAPRNVQLEYGQALSRLEEKLFADDMRLEAFGTALLKMFLAPVMERNEAMQARMAAKLEPLNQEAWPLVQVGLDGPGRSEG